MPLEIVWTPLSRARLKEIQNFIAQDKPIAAARLATRIVIATETLRRYPHLGRAGIAPGIRELPIGRTPYIVVYYIRSNQIIISNIWHGAQNR